MNKKYYLFQVTTSYVTKNKLEADVYLYIKKLDGTLIEADRLSAFKKHFNACIELLNEEHHRCKAISFDWFACNKTRGEQNFSLHFRGSGICNVSLTPAIYEPISESF